jgi:hypothetical protein
MVSPLEWVQGELQRMELQMRDVAETAEAVSDRLFMQLAQGEDADVETQARRVRDYWSERARSLLAVRVADELARVRRAGR